MKQGCPEQKTRLNLQSREQLWKGTPARFLVLGFINTCSPPITVFAT